MRSSLERRWLPDGARETRTFGEPALGPHGRAFNLMAFYLRVVPDAGGQHAFNQINIQAKVYVF